MNSSARFRRVTPRVDGAEETKNASKHWRFDRSKAEAIMECCAYKSFQFYVTIMQQNRGISMKSPV